MKHLSWLVWVLMRPVAGHSVGHNLFTSASVTACQDLSLPDCNCCGGFAPGWPEGLGALLPLLDARNADMDFCLCGYAAALLWTACTAPGSNKLLRHHNAQ